MECRFTVSYEAQISALAGLFAGRGLVPAVAVQRVRVLEVPPSITFENFIEDFASNLAAPQPLTSLGQATGGGQIPTDVTFGFTAKSDQNGTNGNCTVIDRTTHTTVKCLALSRCGYESGGLTVGLAVMWSDSTPAVAGSDCIAAYSLRTSSGIRWTKPSKNLNNTSNSTGSVG